MPLQHRFATKSNSARTCMILCFLFGREMKGSVRNHVRKPSMTQSKTIVTVQCAVTWGSQIYGTLSQCPHMHQATISMVVGLRTSTPTGPITTSRAISVELCATLGLLLSVSNTKPNTTTPPSTWRIKTCLWGFITQCHVWSLKYQSSTKL